MNSTVPNQFPVTDAVKEALAVTLRGCDELIPQDDWVKKLAKSEATGVPLRIKSVSYTHLTLPTNREV